MIAGSSGPLAYVFVYLFVALLAVPAAKRLGLGGVLGYLVAGIVIGPWGLALVSDVTHIEGFSRVMTLMLLFVIALTSTPARVQRLVDSRARLGIAFVGLVALLVFAVALATGLPWHQALVSALALALASDAMASEALRLRYPIGSPLEETGRGLLLTQHLLLVPIVVLLPALGFERVLIEGSPWPRVIAGATLFATVLFAGHVLLKHGFRFVVSVGVDELFAAFVLLVVVGVLLAFGSLGLPLELGALAAGLLLVRSEYGSAIDIAIRPFRGLIVGLFFVGFGMQVDFGAFLRKPLETLSLVVLLIVIKAWVLRTLLRYSEVPRRQRIWLASLLAQGGELAFVVIALAVGYGAIPEKLSVDLVLVATLSMFSTPLLLVLAEGRDRDTVEKQLASGEAVQGAADAQVIVAGYGRVGSTVARLMHANGVRVSIIDNNPDRFAEFRRAGFAGFYGDALRPDLLDAAGARRAVTLVVAIDNAERAQELVRRVRREHPHLELVVRAVDKPGRVRLLALGADRVHRETFESALLMGEDALETVGIGPLDAQAMTETFRDLDEADQSDDRTARGSTNHSRDEAP